MIGGGGTGRQALLNRIVEHMLRTGSATTSLRALAAEIGTSHRMLIYHFGGQEGLVEAVVHEVEARQRAEVEALGAATGSSLAELSFAYWQRLSSPKLRAVEQLFFQLYSRLLDLGRAETAAQLTEAWIEPVAAGFVERGYTPARARAVTRLGVAVYRGLLLDLLATGDKRAVDAAARAYVTAMFGDE